MQRLRQIHYSILPVAPFVFVAWITLGRLVIAEIFWLTEMTLLMAAPILSGLLGILVSVILRRPSVRATRMVSRIDVALLSAVYAVMLLFALNVNSVTDSEPYPSLATRLLGTAFRPTSERAFFLSQLALLILPLVGAAIALLESWREKMHQT